MSDREIVVGALIVFAVTNIVFYVIGMLTAGDVYWVQHIYHWHASEDVDETLVYFIRFGLVMLWGMLTFGPAISFASDMSKEAEKNKK